MVHSTAPKYYGNFFVGNLIDCSAPSLPYF